MDLGIDTHHRSLINIAFCYIATSLRIGDEVGD